MLFARTTCIRRVGWRVRRLFARRRRGGSVHAGFLGAGRCAGGDGLIRERTRSLEQTRGAVVADSGRRTYAPLGRCRCGIWAVTDAAFGRKLLVVLSIPAPRTRSYSPPPCGEGEGVGVMRPLVQMAPPRSHRATPLPT